MAALLLSFATHAGIITTVAGGGAGPGIGDGGPATAAVLYPSRVAVDSRGNLYISEANGNRIRKVDRVTGSIQTLVGTGVSGFSGDGGLAIQAQLDGASQIAVDPAGNVYIADSYNGRIRKVDALTGVISTVAGGGTSGGFDGEDVPAVGSSIVGAVSVAVDPAGNIFFADLYNYRIRRVDVATGLVATVVGTGSHGYSGDGGPGTSAAFTEARSLALDRSGNLFFGDFRNNRIRKWNATTGIVRTVAGTGDLRIGCEVGPVSTTSVSYPEAVAVDAVGNLFVTGSFNHCVRKISAATGSVSVVAGNGIQGFSGDGDAATQASLDYPSGIAIDAAGNLFVADSQNGRVRKVIGVAHPAASARGDFDFDGKSDLAWQHADGRVAVWMMNGLAPTATAEILPAGTGFTVSHVADFDGDGKADLLWAHADGRRAIWLMSGASPTSTAEVLGPGTGWGVAAVADFDGDGKADILGQHADGSVIVRTMSGTAVVSDVVILGPGTGWVATRAADFDGDGKADVLWQHADGRVAVWLMDGTALKSAAEILPAGTGWSVAQVADLDGDGKADIAWKHTDGSVAVWLMNGAAMSSGSGILGAGSGWYVAKTADFDGDGKRDLLWQHPDGRAAIWLMNGLVPSATVQILNAGGGWTAKRTGDLDGDGKADIVWENTDGSVAVWLMNGTVMSSGSGIIGPASGWSVSGASP